MWILSWLRNQTPKPPQPRAEHFRPQLELLEDRCLPTGFGTPTSYSVGTAPQAVVTADLNHDGAPDLIMANLGSYSTTTGTYQGGGVSVLLGLRDNKGQPTGTFAPAQSYAVGSSASLAVGDLNGDGKTDIVTGSGAVLLGKGDGTFAAGPSYAGGLGGYVTLADLNGDGKLDLITAALDAGPFGSSNGVNKISVLLGHGDGTFQAGPTYSTSANLVAVAVGNFNGKLDIITGTNTSVVPINDREVQQGGTVTLSLLPGNGDGTFGAAQTITSFTQSDLEGLTVGDFDGDGRLDLAYASDFYGPSANAYAPTATILRGNGNGAFPFIPEAAGTFTAVSPGTSVGLAAADVNHDGKLDLILVGTRQQDTGYTVVDILPSTTTGFGVDQAFFSGGSPFGGSVSSPTAFAVGDFNADGYGDVAIAGGSSSGGWDIDVRLGTSSKK